MSGLSIPVSWSGDDGNGSGVVAYTVQVQDNGGSWQDWLVGTQQTGAEYQGQPEHTYSFRVKARDRVGHETEPWVVFGPVTVKAVTKYYTLGSQRVAMRQGSQVYYLHGDHLGSVSLTTDEDQEPVFQARYLPYGEEQWREGSSRTDFGFTGQREEVGFGLYDYNARFYSPFLGRFVSPDTIVPGAENPQAWNRYAYTFNNPLNYTDSSGHCPPCDDPWSPLRGMWDQAFGPDIQKAIGDSVSRASAVTHRGISHLAGSFASMLPTVYGLDPMAEGGARWIDHGAEVGKLLTEDLPLLDKNSFDEGLHWQERAAAEGIQIGIIFESTRPLGNLKPLHPPGMNPITERALRNMTDEELLQTVLNPADGEFLKVRPGENELIDGNTRFYEMLQRMLQNPKGTFNPNLKVPVQEVPRAPFPDPLDDSIY